MSNLWFCVNEAVLLVLGYLLKSIQARGLTDPDCIAVVNILLP